MNSSESKESHPFVPRRNLKYVPGLGVFANKARNNKNVILDDSVLLTFSNLLAQIGIFPVGVENLAESRGAFVPLSEKLIRTRNERPQTWIQR